MAGYSGKTLVEKLGIKPGCTVAALHAPSDYLELLEPLPEGVRFIKSSEQPDVIHYFCTERSRLTTDLPQLRREMRDDAALWVSWPKKTAVLATDVTEHVVRELALPLGVVDNKICAIDETWSAVRLVVRLVNRKPSGTSNEKR